MNLHGVNIGPSLMQNPCQKYPQNLLKTGVQGAHFGGLGASFWGSGGFILEPFWGYGRGLAPKVVLEGILGGSRAVLDPNMAPTWAPRWPQAGAKIAPNTMPKLIIFGMRLKIRFRMILVGFLEGKWSQVGAKIGSKIVLILTCVKRAKLL